MLGKRGIRAPGPLPPVVSSCTHLFLCFYNLYFWLCFPFPFPTESLWKNSTLVSVGLGKRGLAHSSARRAKGCQVPGEPRCGWREARAFGGRAWGKPEVQGQGIVTSRGCNGPSGCVLLTLLPDLTSPPTNSVLIGGEELRPPFTQGTLRTPLSIPFPHPGRLEMPGLRGGSEPSLLPAVLEGCLSALRQFFSPLSSFPTPTPHTYSPASY